MKSRAEILADPTPHGERRMNPATHFPAVKNCGAPRMTVCLDVSVVRHAAGKLLNAPCF